MIMFKISIVSGFMVNRSSTSYFLVKNNIKLKAGEVYEWFSSHKKEGIQKPVIEIEPRSKYSRLQILEQAVKRL